MHWHGIVTTTKLEVRLGGGADESARLHTVRAIRVTDGNHMPIEGDKYPSEAIASLHRFGMRRVRVCLVGVKGAATRL